MAKELTLDIDEFLKTVYWTRKAEHRRKQSEANKRFYAKRKAERHKRAVASLERAWDVRMAERNRKPLMERACAFRDGLGEGATRLGTMLERMEPQTWYRIGDLRDANPEVPFSSLRGRVVEAVKRGLVEMKCYRAAAHGARAKFVYCLSEKGEAIRPKSVSADGRGAMDEADSG